MIEDPCRAVRGLHLSWFGSGLTAAMSSSGYSVMVSYGGSKRGAEAGSVRLWAHRKRRRRYLASSAWDSLAELFMSLYVKASASGMGRG